MLQYKSLSLESDYLRQPLYSGYPIAETAAMMRMARIDNATEVISALLVSGGLDGA